MTRPRKLMADFALEREADTDQCETNAHSVIRSKSRCGTYTILTPSLSVSMDSREFDLMWQEARRTGYVRPGSKTYVRKRHSLKRPLRALRSCLQCTVMLPVYPQIWGLSMLALGFLFPPLIDGLL